jgi:hypothetical protein
VTVATPRTARKKPLIYVVDEGSQPDVRSSQQAVQRQGAQLPAGQRDPVLMGIIATPVHGAVQSAGCSTSAPRRCLHRDQLAAGQNGLAVFGMGFSTDTAGAFPPDTLYIAGGIGPPTRRRRSTR